MRKHRGCKRWDYYHLDSFYQYLDDYAAFVQKYHYAIDLYANVDVIPNPKLTWRNQKYLEDQNLCPVPVVHYTTDLKWLDFYIRKGYPVIGLGGLVGSTAEEDCRRWIDKAFQIVCPPPSRLPVVRIHGFGITTYELLIQYPWWSVDSTSWAKVGAYGGILVPHKRKVNGKWTWYFGEQPYLMKVSEDSPDRKKQGRHILTIAKGERRIIQEWLDYIDVPLGKQDKEGDVVEWGVLTHHTYRKAANLFFYEEMRKWLPEYPWKFKSSARKGFGIV